MPGAKLVELDPGDIPAVVRLLGLAYRDNPLTIALRGDDSETRLRVGERIHAIRIAAMEAPIVVRVGNEIVGVYGLEPPGGAPMSLPEPCGRVVLHWSTISAFGPAILKAGLALVIVWTGVRQPVAAQLASVKAPSCGSAVLVTPGRR